VQTRSATRRPAFPRPTPASRAIVDCRREGRHFETFLNAVAWSSTMSRSTGVEATRGVSPGCTATSQLSRRDRRGGGVEQNDVILDRTMPSIRSACLTTPPEPSGRHRRHPDDVAGLAGASTRRKLDALLGRDAQRQHRSRSRPGPGERVVRASEPCQDSLGKRCRARSVSSAARSRNCRAPSGAQPLSIARGGRRCRAWSSSGSGECAVAAPRTPGNRNVHGGRDAGDATRGPH
jgi:hypothetical protein